jgi:hypothetical protein
VKGDGYQPAATGCTGCGTQDTVIVDGINGRRCAACAPASAAHLIDAWPRDRALELIDEQPRHAWLRSYLPRLLGGAR